MLKLPITMASPVLRTDFTDDDMWAAIRQEIIEPSEMGFEANVEFIDDRAFKDITPEQLLEMIPDDNNHTFIIVVDHVACSSPDHAVLVVDIYENRGRHFRSICSEIWGIENNLSIANMDFGDFADAVDTEGVFRGF